MTDSIAPAARAPTVAEGATVGGIQPEGAAEGYPVRRHYDVPTKFYSLWLDPTLSYSCALWSDSDNLQLAQERKLDYLIREADAAGAERVLDVGCGWGSLMHRLVEKHGVQIATGITVSESQASYVAESANPKVDVRLAGWREFVPGGSFDAIISIGAIEHFANLNRPREERVATYREFFASAQSWLLPGRRFALQSVVRGSEKLDRQAVDDLRLTDEVLPDSAIPWLSEILQGFERRFELERLVIHGQHYAKTCRAWATRLGEQHDAAVGVVGDEVTERYCRYLEASARLFERGHLTLSRVTLRRC